MWNTFSTDAVPGISARLQTMTSMAGDEINAYVAQPDGAGPFPGLVMMLHPFGFDEIYFEYARRFAMHGFNVIVPNLFFRYGHGTPDDVIARVRGDNGLADDSAVADAHGALRYLNALSTSNGKVGVTGFCGGGRLAVLAAGRIPEFDAVADLWGGDVVAGPDRLAPKRPVAPVDLIPQLNAAFIGVFGNDDTNPGPESVDQLEAALQAAGKTYMLHRYDGAGHGIWYYHMERFYRPQAAIDSWNKVEDWFNQYLRDSMM
jgi:carboxymethylenebutenolidase